jgi:hypothetical protein
MGRNLQTPTSNALDYLGRATTSTADALGRSLRAGELHTRSQPRPVAAG